MTRHPNTRYESRRHAFADRAVAAVVWLLRAARVPSARDAWRGEAT